ncbi:MAG: aldehyde dehydrogenase family protein, partial [Candidatus Omnitrophica bacterium]|nr:aldehyde dehydrogenase family protein [Candidatus Omnitrophota bacterium]
MKFTSNACFKSINPSNEQIIDKFEFVTHDEAIMAVERSQNAFLDWKTKNFTTKTALLHRASELLTSRKEEYSRLMSEEMGKPLIQAVAEVEKCAVVCEYYAKNGERFLSDETIETDATR